MKAAVGGVTPAAKPELVSLVLKNLGLLDNKRKVKEMGATSVVHYRVGKSSQRNYDSDWLSTS
jgi:hypothetical protein